jgi:hypothetical protein
MSTLTYRQTKAGISVLADGRLVGHIRANRFGMWCYAPKGSAVRGEPFRTIAECKRSIEARGAA